MTKENISSLGNIYLTKENINSLYYIISNINSIDDETEKNNFLNEHIEDLDMFFKVLKKINKSKIPQKSCESKIQKKKNVVKELYKEEEIFEIFVQKDNETIMKECSLADLKRMYASIYNREAASNYTKKRIVNILRDRMHTMNRASAFAKLAEERNIRK